MMQEHSDELPPLLASSEGLCHQVSNIFVGGDVCSAPFIAGTALAHEMVRDALRLLLQRRFRHHRIAKHRLVVAIDERRFVHRDSHHSQLVTKATSILARLLHRNKLAAKGARLAGRLLLRRPVNRRVVQEHHEARSRSARNSVSSVVAIHIDSHAEASAARRWHSRRELLLQISVARVVNGVAPVLSLEIRAIELNFAWIEYHFCVVMLFQVSKDVEDLLERWPARGKAK